VNGDAPLERSEAEAVDEYALSGVDNPPPTEEERKAEDYNAEKARVNSRIEHYINQI